MSPVVGFVICLINDSLLTQKIIDGNSPNLLVDFVFPLDQYICRIEERISHQLLKATPYSLRVHNFLTDSQPQGLHCNKNYGTPKIIYDFNQYCHE